MADVRGRVYRQLPARTAALLDGRDNVEDWDDDELRHGYRKSKDGTFSGRPPALVPLKAYKELLRRRLRETEQIMVDSLPAAARTLQAIMESPFAEDRDRIKAAQLLIERVMGKAIERVELGLNADPPWMEALKGGIVDVDEPEVIDVDSEEVIWDDEEDQ